MKKLFLMAVAAVAMLATSCSKDDTNAVAVGEKSTVTFAVEAPVMATRAADSTYGDGYTATHLTWGVYDANNNYLEDLSAEGLVGVDFPTGSLSTSVKIDLVNGKEYKVIFWAGADGSPYKVDFKTKQMTYDYNEQNPLLANQEKYDAFYKYQAVGEVKGPHSETVTLTRPFAQLNIATADTAKAKDGGLEVEKTQVVVKTYNTLDLVNGDVSGDTTHTYKFSTIPSDANYVNTITVGGKTYDLLSMNYLLVNTKQLANVEFTVKNGNFKKPYTYSNVPLQRNHKTNIIGNLLTSTLDFEITIDPIFEKPDYESTGFVGAKVGGNVYQTLAEAIANAYDGDVIELSKGEFEFPTLISTKGTRAAERFLTFAGQGDETVISFSSQAGSADGGLNCYADGLSLKFRDLKVVSPNTGSSYSGGFGRAKSIEFNNCTYVGQYRSHGYTKWEDCTIDPQTSYIYTDAVNVDFINCKFNSSEGKGIQVYGDPDNFSSTINVIGCEFVAAKQGLTGGGRPVSAIDINSQGEKFTVNIKNTTAEGYYGPGDYSGNGLWNIKGGVEHITVMVDGKLAAISVGTNEKLDSALKENKEYINVKLTGNVSLNTQDAYLKLGGEDTKVITIDGNYNTLTLSTTYWSRFSTVNPDAKVVLKNMDLTSSQETGTWNSYDITINCNVELENVTLLKALAFDGANTVASLKNVTIKESHDYYALWISAAGQKVTIDGLTILSAGRGIKIDEQYVDAVAKVTLNINNAKFVTKKKAAIMVKSEAGADINVSNIDITKVNDDSEFAVWVDEDSKAYADLVVVNGAKVIVEGTVAAETAENLVEALENGEDVLLTNDVKIEPAGMSNAYGTTGINVKNGQTIDGGGHILDIKGAGGTWDSGISTTGGLIKNITITGSFRGVFVNHNSTHSEKVVLNNVIIDGTTYTISCDQGTNNGLEAKDSTFKGWTSYAATLGEASFTDCKFGRGNGYAFCRPYAPTKFVGCDFEAGFTVDPRANVEFENCTYGGVALTADNIADLVTNTAKVTVK